MIIPIIILALVLRIVLINQSFWLDEAIGATVSQSSSYPQLISEFLPRNFHPPLNHLLFKTWGEFWGYSEISLRSLSLVAGLLTIYLVYLICTNLAIPGSIKLGKTVFKTADLAALLLAINPLHIYYSQEAWHSSLSAFFAAFSIFSYIRLSHKPNISSTLLLGASFSASMYSYYPLVLLNLGILLHSSLSRHTFFPTLTASSLALVSYIPWLKTLKLQLATAQMAKNSLPLWCNVLGKTGPKSLILVWVKFLIGRISFYSRIGYLAFVTLISVIPLISLFIAWVRKKEISLIWFWLLVPLSLSAIAGLVAAGFSYFRLVFLLPAFIILITCGLIRLGKFSLFLTLASSATSILIFWFNPRFHRENWRDAVKFIEAEPLSKKIAVMINYSQSAPYKYYSKKGVPLYSARDWDENPQERIFLIRYVQPIFDPEEKLKMAIESYGYLKIQEKDFNGVTVWEYIKK